MSRRSVQARDFGLRAETLATLWLQSRFYQILDRNFSASGGEIDIVARRGEVIAFVEVKARPSLEEAQVAIGATKTARISRTAHFWLARNRWAADMVLRGDAIFISPWRLPLHVENAFSLDFFR
jgi:putative endonuclease